MDTISTLKTKVYSLKRSILMILTFLLAGTASNAQSGEKCFIKRSDPNTVNAKFNWTYNPGPNTYTVRVTLSKGFVDNTYGTNSIGWGSRIHKFSELVGSDHVQIALSNGAGARVLEFRVDYLSSSNTSPSGYTTQGVKGGDGKMVYGDESNVVAARTSLDENLKICPTFTTNSPSTDANYSPSPECPGWDFNVWYEVEVKASVFGGSGFGSPSMTGVHASPSKTGNNTEIVEEGPCPGTVKLGNQVWDDTNNNGTLDAGEKGISGLVVKLYNCSGTLIATTTTDASGYYYFSNLADGSYVVAVVSSQWYIKGTAGSSSSSPDNNIDNDNNGVIQSGNEIRTNCITLNKGQEPVESGNGNFSVDIALVGNGSGPISGELCYVSPTKGECVNARVQYTINTNSTVTVRVIFSKCFVDNTYGTTAVGWPNGHKFGDLVGSDRIQMVLYDANNVKKMDFEVDYISSSTAVPSGYKSLGVSGGEGDMNLGNESDVVAWKTSLDANLNDLGYPQYTTNSPATDANYSPNAAAPNWIYDVWYEVTVKSSAFGTAGFGKVLIPYVHASPSKTGSNTETVEPGNCPAVLTLGNLVFEDKNGDGVYNSGDAGIPGLSVKLYQDADANNQADGASVSSTTTNSSGQYLFTNLAAGNYIVGVSLPSGYQKGATITTTANPNNDVDNDNNGITTVGTEVRTNRITLAAASEPNTDGDGNNGNLTLDIALEKAAQTQVPLNLGDLVWNDANQNGVKDASESGMTGISVNLYRDANSDNIPDGAAIQTTVTGPNGIYSFSNLEDGRYIVGVVAPTGFSGTVATSTSLSPDNDVNNDNNGVTTVTGGEVLSRAITLSAGAEPTTDGDGNNGNLTLDFGLRSTSGSLTIGDYVWEDENGNGLQDANEFGIPGARVTLTLPDGSTRVTTTSGEGYYYFNNLVPGAYQVCFETPGGYRPATPNAGGDDRDSDPVNGCVTVNIANAPGNLTVDAGFVQVLLNLGNKVFNDENENGVWDAVEPGIASVTVNLYRDANGDNNPDGMAVSTTVTDANGNYNFTSLAEGRYLVGIVINPTMWQNGPIPFTGVNPDSNVDNDNNGIVTFNNEVFSRYITLTGGSEPTGDGDGADGNLTLDFGLVECPPAQFAVTLGNRVWSDLNSNGRCDAGEPGLANVTVKLYEDANGDNVPDGPAIGVTTTSGDGSYQFNNINNGRYIVGVVLPQGYVRGPQVPSGMTPDNNIDCDNNGVFVSSGEVRTSYISLTAGTEPTTDGDGNNGNLTLDFGVIDQSRIPLPVTLIEFTGSANGNVSSLKWKVANESQMDHYVIERSQDGSNFMTAGKVNSLNSASATYSYNDPVTGNASVLYYRLRNVGQSGNSSYSNIIALRFGSLGRSVMSVYPNPVRSYTVINLGVQQNSNADLQLISASGQVIFRKSYKLNTGSNALTLDGLDRFGNGTYTVNVKLDNGEQYQHKILIIK